MESSKNIASKLFVIITFVVAIFLYYSNSDQFISDNSLFYPVVAENIWTTGISTFNGYIETNGYQPLWMFFSVLAVALCSWVSWDMLIVLGVIYHIFLAGAIILVFKMAKRWPFFSAPIVAVTFIFMFIANGVLHNMESAMALFFVLLTLYYGLKMEEVSKKSFFVFGLLLGLTFLSRLDLLFFGLILLSYLLFQYRVSIMKEPQLLAFLLFGVTMIVAPYLWRNIEMFGHWLPISEGLSQGLPRLSYAWANIYPYGAVSLVIALIEWGIAWTAKTREARVIILIMSISTIFQIIYVAFFQHPQSWYFITGFINFAIILGYIVKKIDKVWITCFVFASLVLATVGSAYLKTVSNYALSAHVLRLYQDKVGKAGWIFSNVAQKRMFSERVSKVLSKSSTVITWYFPGSLAYYGKLKVFAANGLSNGLITNTTYDKELMKNSVEKTVAKYAIQYNILPFSRGNVLWYKSLGFVWEKKEGDGYDVLMYSRLASNICAMMHYDRDDTILKVKSDYSATGYVGLFPVKKMFECPDKAKNYKKSGFYSTVIEK